tara:strand:+ start:1948 stop:2520 length:573 start_codon:yes stop_codon:yes gene_type:complete
MIKNSLGNIVLLELKTETEDKHTLSDGTELWLDTEIDRLWHARQNGIVKHLPPNPDKRVEDNLQLKKGDKVFIHHLVIDKTLEFNGEKYYQSDIDQIYAYERDGEITMLMDFIFVEPIKTKEQVSDSGIITNIKKEITIDKGVVTHINQFTEEFKVGDTILFQKNSNYKMKINDRELYRMRNSNAMCILP